MIDRDKVKSLRCLLMEIVCIEDEIECLKDENPEVRLFTGDYEYHRATKALSIMLNKGLINDVCCALEAEKKTIETRLAKHGIKLPLQKTKKG